VKDSELNVCMHFSYLICLQVQFECHFDWLLVLTNKLEYIMVCFLYCWYLKTIWHWMLGWLISDGTGNYFEERSHIICLERLRQTMNNICLVSWTRFEAITSWIQFYSSTASPVCIVQKLEVYDIFKGFSSFFFKLLFCPIFWWRDTSLEHNS
jgi:hypothetical protein